MKILHIVAAAMLLGFAPGVSGDATNPIQKVLELIGSLQQKLLKSGEESHKGYMEYANMCQDRSVEFSHEIKTAKAKVEDLKATIDKAADDEAEMKSRIEDLSAIASNSEADAKAAAKIRKKEAEDFALNQKDLIDTIGQMERAISIMEKMQQSKASLAQLPLSVQKGAREVQRQRAAALAEVFSVMIDSSSLDTADSSRLASLIQSSSSDTDTDTESAADAADMDAAEESYTGEAPENSGSIIETLENLLEKAQGQLESARSKETKSRHNQELFAASLGRKLAQAQKDMLDTKKALGVAGQTRAQAEGDVTVTTKDLAEDNKALNELHRQCMDKASDYEEEMKSREEELKALAAAKKTIKEMTGSAEGDTYGKTDSFLQVKASSLATSPTVKAVRMVKDLGKNQNLPGLVQMAQKMESIIRHSAINGDDPFAKVKGMITSMVSHLTKKMEDEASQKSYCDKEMGDTKKSKASKESTVDKLQTRLDGQNSEKMNLKEQVVMLQQEISSIVFSQKEIDRMRKEEHARYVETKPGLKEGQEGIKTALKVLRKYYSKDDEKDHQAEDGAGSTIIGMLEVVESDIAKNLANLDQAEDSSQNEYDEQTKENEVSKATKQEAVTHLNKEIKMLSKSASESSTDLDGVQSELDAVNEYFNKIQENCIGRPDHYEERRKRQETTMQGLQDAMQILQGRAALAQENARRLRGVSSHQQTADDTQPDLN